jgi:hypothetical protein
MFNESYEDYLNRKETLSDFYAISEKISSEMQREFENNN